MGSSLIWLGWNEVPSASGPPGQTNVGLAVRQNIFRLKMVLIAQGLDRAVWLNTTTDYQNWSGWKSIGGQTGFALSATPAILGELVVWATATHPPGHIFHNVTIDGQNWAGWGELGGGGVIIAAPATSRSHILVPGTDARVYIKSLFDNSPFTKLPPETSLPRRVCA